MRQWIDLPHPLPDYLVEQLEVELDPPTRTATEQAAQEALQRLQRVMDGYSSRHSWDIKSVPQDQCLSLIHQAIKKGHQLQLTYYSASRQVRTNRTIEPYRLEWSHQTPYLIAYCRQAHAERRFRVDRIEAIQLIEIEKPQHKENLQASWLT